MAGRTGSPTRRRIAVTGAVVAVLAVLAAAGWYGYVWLAAPMDVLSRTGEVDTASRSAKAESERRLEEIVDALPGAPRLLGEAAADHCLRHPPFEGEPAGPLTCQWRLDRYVVFEGNLRTVGGEWRKALTDDRWKGSRVPFPPGFRSSSERYEYHDPRTRDRLDVTLTRDSDGLRSLYAPPAVEPFVEYEREQRGFTGRDAAERAVAEGRRVARISLVHAYYGQDGRAPFAPLR